MASTSCDAGAAAQANLASAIAAPQKHHHHHHRSTCGGCHHEPPQRHQAPPGRRKWCHRKDAEFLIRPSWVDAALALKQIDKGKASGRRASAWVRSWAQGRLYRLGTSVHAHAGKVIFVATLLIACFAVGLKSASSETRVHKLWVEEGGQLERELRYAEAALGGGPSAAAATGGSTHQLLIQTPHDAAAAGGLLRPEALLAHLDAVSTAASVTVHLFDITWRLKDLCYSPSIPSFDYHYIDQIMENIFPCSIITPLDCFWEGSKLLGPDYPVTIPGVGSSVRWTNLNPEKMVAQMKEFNLQFPFETLEEFMKRAGISTAYQEKPCLNPRDHECPDTAPNKQSGQAPNVGAELTGGCYGFAAKYMHWPEELLVGGATKNKTGHIVRAKALQTVVQLMGERELYEYWSDDYKVHHVDWTQEKASLVLDTWQRRFSEEVKRLMSQKDNSTSPYDLLAFSTATLDDILSRFSEVSITRIAIGYVAMLVYAGLSLLRLHDPVRSQCGVGLAGVLLVGATVAAGLGFCALLGISFNAATTQIVPFLALGLGVDDVFLITHAYGDQLASRSDVSPEAQTGTVLKRTGVSILLTSLSTTCAFFAAALIPIPALRVFSLQAAILVLFNLAATLLVFPAIVSLDLRRRRSGRADILCCFVPPPGAGYSHPPSFQRRPPLAHPSPPPPAPPSCSWWCFSSPSPAAQQHQLGSTQEHPCSCGRDRPKQAAPGAVPQCRVVPLPPPAPAIEPSPTPKRQVMTIARALPPDRLQTVTVLAPPETEYPAGIGQGSQSGSVESLPSSSSTRDLLTKGAKAVDVEAAAGEGDWGRRRRGLRGPFWRSESAGTLHGASSLHCCPRCTLSALASCSLSHIAAHHYAPLLMKPSVKVSAMVVLALAVAAGAWAAQTRLGDGLALTELVPIGTAEHAFLKAQASNFGFYGMYAVTRGDFEYPTNQRLLYEYHDAYVRVPYIVRNDDGGLPEFWLSMFREWLLGLQSAFDRDWADGRIIKDRWFSNASDDGILAYKLLVQTGRVDNPVDRSLVTTGRLVDSDGVINPKAFYNYLSAWASNDALAYGASQANLRPEPRHWLHSPSDYELKIPKSAPLVYAQMPFYVSVADGRAEATMLTDEGDSGGSSGGGDWSAFLSFGGADPSTTRLTELLRSVRELCGRFEARGLPNFPAGIPFLFWQQYLGLRGALAAALGAAIAAAWAAAALLLLDAWGALLVASASAATLVQMMGVAATLGVRLSAIPAVLLVIGVGLSARIFLQVSLGFVTSVGGKDRRAQLALESVLAPAAHGAITTLLGISLLAFSEFDFIVKYFFHVLFAFILVGLLNGLVIFPVLLSLIGPSAEVVPHDNPERMSTPSPEPSPLPRYRRGSQRDQDRSWGSSSGHISCHGSRRAPAPIPLHRREPSLTTITEEASWNSAASNQGLGGGGISSDGQQQPQQQQTILVQPELVLETTTTTSYHHPPSGRPSSPSNTQNKGNQQHSECSSSVSSSSDTSGAAHTPPPGHCSTTTSSSSSSVPHVTTTKVTATAKVKLEVHGPLSSSVEREPIRVRRYRDHTSGTDSSSDAGSGKYS
ncbi:protein patched [Ischnura elegans]|uniref:protein patched n=1 Tax=Ischnura elegans TaxID=197161 RepID=UPI001ED86665|nr:protein patched [Ischnura elegans]